MSRWRDLYMCSPEPSPFDERLRAALPCPFCASRQRLSFSQTGHYVHCDRCGADGPEVAKDAHRSGEERWQLALKRWNQRLTPPTA